VARVEPVVLLAGRYALYDKIAAGGMATVHFGRLLGPSGFARTVAIKRLFPQFAADPEFVAMFLDEARLVSRIRSPYVVPTLDMVHVDDELCIVMEYVPGESLSRLARPVSGTEPDAAAAATGDVPVAIAVSLLDNVLEGLHAAHEARSEQGEPLGIVHRDVSPQNVIVGTDGLGHVIDFGVAKAVGRLQTTREGQLKGKLAYMAPEQLRGDPVTRRSDLYAASVVLWETLVGQRLFRADDEASTVTRVLMGEVKPPSQCLRKDRDAAEAEAIARLDAVVMRGLDRDPARRFETARDMAAALEVCVPPAGAATVGAWLERVAGPALALRAARIAEIESSAASETTLPIAMPEQPTQASSISVASSVTSAPSSKRRRAWIAVAALGLLGVGAVVSLAWHGTRTQPTGVASPASAPPVAPSMDVAPPASTDDQAASAPPAPSAPPSAVAAPSAAAPPTRRPPAAPASNCNPPFTWDAQGKKHYKRNCL
jgi:serine/threonine-protein kinase